VLHIANYLPTSLSPLIVSPQSLQAFTFHRQTIIRMGIAFCLDALTIVDISNVLQISTSHGITLKAHCQKEPLLATVETAA
jgi:hypothetical protein